MYSNSFYNNADTSNQGKIKNLSNAATNQSEQGNLLSHRSFCIKGINSKFYSLFAEK